MTKEFKTIDQLIEENYNFISAIPNYLGINLGSVEGIEFTRQDDGQLISLNIIFKPTPVIYHFDDEN